MQYSMVWPGHISAYKLFIYFSCKPCSIQYLCIVFRISIDIFVLIWYERIKRDSAITPCPIKVQSHKIKPVVFDKKNPLLFNLFFSRNSLILCS